MRSRALQRKSSDTITELTGVFGSGRANLRKLERSRRKKPCLARENQEARDKKNPNVALKRTEIGKGSDEKQ